MDVPPTLLFHFLPLRCLSYAETAITLIVGASKLCADCKRLDSLVIWSIIRANFQQLLIFGGARRRFFATQGNLLVGQIANGDEEDRRARAQLIHKRLEKNRCPFLKSFCGNDPRLQLGYLHQKSGEVKSAVNEFRLPQMADKDFISRVASQRKSNRSKENLIRSADNGACGRLLTVT
jgi:hypothetical protein